ncbi:MAG: DUF4124 domain-containing protein [Gammaproteobacteria bacterium]
MDIRIIGCAVLVVFASSSSVAGTIKKWVDQEGSVHFGDVAPVDTDSTTLDPEIITTMPAHKPLKEILRPGERQMLKRYEQRGQRLLKAKNQSLKQHKKKQKESTLTQDKCQYHQLKKEELQRRLRHGYKVAQRKSIEIKIAKEQLLIKQHCD